MILTTRKVLRASATAILVLLATGVTGAHAEAPVKPVLASQYGAKVNLNESSFCLQSECEPAGAQASTAPGGFAEKSPKGVAVAPDGNVYVADSNYQRVQELTPAGEFVLMVGEDVNETTGGNICTAEEVKSKGVKCEAGLSSAAAGGFDEPTSLAVDPDNGNVYVEDFGNNRVQELTATGQFVLMIGEEVNQTEDGAPGASEAQKSICTAESGNVCKAGVQATVGSTQHGAFSLPGGSFDDLAAGGPTEDLLYVGDEHRVQEFKPDGTWVQDLPLSQISSLQESKARDLALDQASGELYLTYFSGREEPTSPLYRTVLKFKASGQQVGELVLHPREAGGVLEIKGIAVDSSGRLAVVEFESNELKDTQGWFGSLLHAETGKPITQFTVFAPPFSSLPPTVAFSAGTVGAGEQMYGAFLGRHELVRYEPKMVAELVTGALACKEEGEQETSVTLQCGLGGQVNPESVSGTETWFVWGASELLTAGALETTKHAVATGAALVTAPPATITGLKPDETIYYELAGDDEFVTAFEHLSGEELSAVTPLAAPRIVGTPSVSYVKSDAAVMSGDLNPENAPTEYFFEYGPGDTLGECPHGVAHEECPGVARTSPSSSAAYRTIATTFEATSLQPATVYHYRLVGESENAIESRTSLEIPNHEDEGLFTTAAAPNPQASTGPPSSIAATAAIVSGSVDPDGQAATYQFELGLYNGENTHLGVVLTAEAGTGVVPSEERLALAGLRPGTTYAYRIAISSGHATSPGEPTTFTYGAIMTFTTAGIPEALSLPAVPTLVPVPAIAFPTTVVATTTKPGTKTKTHKTNRKGKKHKGARTKQINKTRCACQKAARGKK